MIRPCLDLALGRAFTPDPIDTSVPLARRFARRPLVAVTIHKDGFEAAAVTFEGGVPVLGESVFKPTGGEDVDAPALRSIADRFKAADCVINLATSYTAVLSSRARRPESDEEAILLMRDNPERILGEAPVQGSRHSVAFHPTHNYAVVFAHKDTEIAAAANLAAKAELGVARLQCGTSSLLIHLIGNHWEELGREAEILLLDRSSLFYMPVSEGSFGRPLFDVGLREAALARAVTERIGKLKPGGRLILVNSSPLDVEAMIRDAGTGVEVVSPLRDRKNPALWACLNDRPRLGYDLYPGERTVRPFAPPSLRIVPAVFWCAFAAAFAVVGINTLRESQAARQARSLGAQIGILDNARDRNEKLVGDIRAREETAKATCDWLLISPPTQALLVDITREIEGAYREGLGDNKPVARVDSLSITRQEGQPQMRLAIVVLGEGPAANRVFQRISALFGRLGYSTVDLKETLVPRGFRYEHLLNIPKPFGT